jgi:hypothetical protein
LTQLFLAPDQNCRGVVTTAARIDEINESIDGPFQRSSGQGLFNFLVFQVIMQAIGAQQQRRILL